MPPPAHPPEGPASRKAEPEPRDFEHDTEARSRLESVQRSVQAKGYFDATDFATIKALYRSFPTAPPVIFAYDRALWDRGDFGALIQLHTAQSKAERNPLQQRYLAELMIEAKRFAEACDVLLPMLTANPKDIDVAWPAARALFAQGRDNEAARILDSVWDELLAAGQYDAMLLRGLIHLHADELDSAARLLKKLLALRPDHVPANNALGRVLAAAGDDAQARIYLNRAARMHERINADEKRRARLTAHVRAIENLVRDGRFAKAEQEIGRLLPTIDGPAKARLLGLLHEVQRATGRDAKPG